MAPNRDNVEPSAKMRRFAGELFQMHTALVQAGFSNGQALQIIGQVIASSIGKAGGGNGDG